MADSNKHDQEDVIRQQQWSKKELRKQGFHPYARKKQVVMARQLSELEGPLVIESSSSGDLIAKPGYMICYEPGDTVRHDLNSYKHWPVAPDIFEATYREWDEEEWEPTPPEKHLMKLGCLPYYKAAGVWAKQTDQDMYLQSIENKEPVKVETGRYIAIGHAGEPYQMGDKTFQERYQTMDKRSLLRRLLAFFKGDNDK